MNQLDFAALLVAGACGTFFDQKVAWGIVMFWSLMKLLHIL